MKVALLLLLAPLAMAITCTSAYPELQSLCDEVAPKVESLWGSAEATVALSYGSDHLTVGVPLSHSYSVTLKEPDPCALAHELTHVIELERGAVEPDWFAEGLADLSCFLLYPDLYAGSGYAEWVSRGYGSYSPYFFGVTVLYYWLARGGEVWELKDLSFKEASRLFAEALERGITPYGVRPKEPLLIKVFLRRGWAYGGSPSGEYWKFGSVAVFYGPGEVSYGLPFILPFLAPSWLRKCGSGVRRLRRKAVSYT
ncbi:MAG: hypothetical protein GXO07_06730 [Crenarchaeota archaeon]|nr:hypothetical protein [Thermoproteota archaeon]